jgi:hypothetical protein
MNIVYLVWNFTPENALSSSGRLKWERVELCGRDKNENPHHDWQGF